MINARANKILSLLFVILAVSTLYFLLYYVLGEQKYDSDRELDEVSKRLRDLGYLDFAVEDELLDEGVIFWGDMGEIYEGYNIFTLRRSNTSHIMDNEGRYIHNWSHKVKGGHGHVVIAENLSLYIMQGLYDAEAIHLIGRDSNMLEIYPGKYHHDLYIHGTDTLITLDDVRRNVNYGGKMRVIWDNHIVYMDLDGAIKRRISLFNALKDLVTFGDTMDVLHANTISFIDRDVGYAKKGDILTCMRHTNTVAIIDPDTGGVIWIWGRDVLDGPHKPVLLENGNILIFDNGMERNYSRVIEVNPIEDRIVWEYLGDPPESFYTKGSGFAQPLPNGNILITESNKGRVFEITRDKEKVWEYIAPKDEDGNRPTIYRMTRVSKGYVEKYL
jgi:hypothetical protein